MKVQDFFSIVQLGVGIHLGTAVLHLTGEFGIAPVERRVDNIANWLREERETGNMLEAKEDELKDIQMRVNIFKTQYANAYRKLVIFMVGWAGILTSLLAVTSFNADADIGIAAGMLIVLACVLPACLSFAYIWQRSRDALAPILRSVGRMEGAIRVTPTE
jgi:hypothetical protein